MRGNDTVVTVAITPSCRRKFHLMSEDSVSLSFSLAEAVPILPGDYIDDELFGRFYAKEQQMPTYNPRTCGFDYSLVFVKWYWLWDSHMLMYCDVAYENAENSVPVLGVANDHRKEASWVLTETLEYHVKAALTNVKLLGMLPKKNTIAYKTLNYDLSTCERKGEVRFLSYDHVGIIKGLSMMAEEYGCEWWVTENDEYVTVHFGKCESGEAMEFTLNDNVETMSTQRNQNSYANRVYALGSTKNLPISYRRTLGTFTVMETQTHTVSDADIEKYVIDPETGIIDVTGKPKGYIDEDGNTVFPPVNIKNTSYFRVKLDKDITCNMARNAACYISYTYKELINGLYLEHSVFRVACIDSDGWLYFPEDSEEHPFIPITSSGAPIVYQLQTPSGLAVNTKVSLSLYDPTYNEDGRPFYNLMGLIITKIPDAWWLGTDDDPSSLFSFGERRLMLPIADAPNGYLQTDGALDEFQRIEEVVKFEGVFPRCYLEVTKVTAKEMNDKGQELLDGSTRSWKWKQYTIEARNYLDGSEFPFVASFVKNDELAAVFLSEMDAENAYGAGWQSSGNYLLAGMTFKVEFHEYDTTENGQTVHVREYKLLPNEDYGAFLPNETLCPSVGDVFVLTGWDVKNMESLGMVAQAEQDLKYYTQEYLDAIEEGNFLFQCNMRSDWPFTLATTGHPYNLPTEGQRVAIYHDALKENADADGQRVKLSRVIGYEFKLDIPYDSPMYEVGETDAFSRLKRLEKAMSGDTSAYPIRVRERDSSGDVIVFADPAVKALCVSNWGGNVVEGEITKGEAAAVTSLGGVFMERTDIKTFDELRFFTGLTSMRIEGSSASNSHGEFSGCTNLTSVKLPTIDLSYIRMDGAFRDTKITELDFRHLGDTKVILQSVVYNNTALTKVYLPKFVSTSSLYAFTWAFRGCTALTTLDASDGSDWSAIARYSDFVRDCTSLTTIVGTITGIGASVTNASYSPNFSSCPLTADSAMVIINGLADLTGKTSKTLTLSSTTKSALTAAGIDYAAIASAKNWQIS